MDLHVPEIGEDQREGHGVPHRRHGRKRDEKRQTISSQKKTEVKADGMIVQFELLRSFPAAGQEQDKAREQRERQGPQHQGRSQNRPNPDVGLGFAVPAKNGNDGDQRFGQRRGNARKNAADRAVGNPHPAAEPLDAVCKDGGPPEDDGNPEQEQQQRNDHEIRRRARSTSCMTRRSGSPVCSAIRLQSRYSGLALSGPPLGTWATLTRTSPNFVATSVISRASTRRATSWTRTPNVVVSANTTFITASSFPGSASTVNTMPGRPRFMITGVSVASNAPCASNRSINSSYACGFISSRLVSNTMMRSDSAVETVSPRNNRSALAQSGGLKAPAP